MAYEDIRGFADCGDPAARSRFLGRLLGSGGQPMAQTWPSGEQAWSHAQARAFIAHVVGLFHKVDVDGLAQGFAEDCVVRHFVGIARVRYRYFTEGVTRLLQQAGVRR